MIFQFSLLFIFSFCNNSRLEAYLSSLNKNTLPIIHNLIREEFFSKIKFDQNKPCSFKRTKKCNLLTCIFQKNKIPVTETDGKIDLIEHPEVYTANTDSGDIWAEMYRLAGSYKMKRILSGFQYSITTHLCRFHKKHSYGFIPNPYEFKRRYKPEYEENFFLVYLLMRSAISCLKIETLHGKIPVNCLSQIEKINKKIGVFEFPIKEYLEGVGENEIKAVEEIIKLMPCMNCGRCVIWGTIHTTALKAMLKIYCNLELQHFEIISLFNIFFRFSTTLKESIFMKNTKIDLLYLLLIYQREIAVMFISIIIFLILNKYSTRNNNEQ
ncbi:Endoplasmic oxidoreductin-1 [Astathelohania contejeani]|uniref:Endoplasmic oxidoreductin-1 n=1 Tax=Astathelohania contejeani TaxID=164912 RepID=A0ABQ7I304_9MICR|nr:Endoplasmic oxidoreductin-1 [Thelohania contejeani]